MDLILAVVVPVVTLALGFTLGGRYAHLAKPPEWMPDPMAKALDVLVGGRHG